jgi:hypothetical protein
MLLFIGTYHQGTHQEDPFQEGAFHQGGMGDHLEASWAEILGREGMGAALSHDLGQTKQ